LAQAFAFVTRGGESRSPIRETRGFSRAQTGDTLTAIIPLAWSITMLLQASTHSSNFDENTDNTSLSLTIIAYQWGWSYFFPLDTIRAFGSTSGAQ
jgi:heme/copper-type cytochrome/quinol oxidase subunit 2